MPTFKVTTKGIRELQDAMKKYPQTAKPVIARAMHASQAILAKHTKKNDPIPWQTGNLLQSFRHKATQTSARWFPTASYAIYVHEGTKPHTIFPIRKKALKWEKGATKGRYVTSKSGKRRYQKGKAGEAIFAKRVNHPGTKAQPFMIDIFENSRDDLDNLFEEATKQITNKLARSV